MSFTSIVQLVIIHFFIGGSYCRFPACQLRHRCVELTFLGFRLYFRGKCPRRQLFQSNRRTCLKRTNLRSEVLQSCVSECSVFILMKKCHHFEIQVQHTYNWKLSNYVVSKILKLSKQNLLLYSGSFTIKLFSTQTNKYILSNQFSTILLYQK